MIRPELQVQEISYDSPASNHLFVITEDRKLKATRTAIEMYQEETIFECWKAVRVLAHFWDGLDFYQTFTASDKAEALWIIEEEDRIFVRLPSDDL